MRIITLINDWKQDPLYITQIYGAFLNIASNIQIVNITPDIKNYDNARAAFVLRKSFAFYPAGTIHFNFIDDLSNYKNYLIAKHKEQYIVSPDNGFLSLAIGKKIEELYLFPKSDETFAKIFDYSAILQIIIDEKTKGLLSADKMKDKYFPQPVFKDNSIIAHILYIDSYGNLITNLTKKKFVEAIANKGFKIILRSSSSKINFISDNYEKIESGDLFAVFNVGNLLEIGQKGMNLANLMNYNVLGAIRIEIFDKEPSIF